MKKILRLIFVFVFIFICINAIMNIKIFNKNTIKETMLKAIVGNPIDLDTGLINNEYFSINSNGKNASKTTKGINDAIKYANENNIEYIKLEKGTYLITGIGKNNIAKGIILQSNITLDLNESTIKHEKNSAIRYTGISIFNVENVTIMNGKIVGDKDEHNYTKVESTHEWGYGLDIRGGFNVTLKNLEITKFTGDGIMICELPDYKDSNQWNVSEKIHISSCNIYACRRQGVSILSGKDIRIYENEIHDINGTNPQAAIDLESTKDSEVIDNIKIYRNKFYNLGDTIAILSYKTTNNVDIYENDIEGKIVFNTIANKAQIYENTIKNGRILVTTTEEYKGTTNGVNKILISRNKLINTSIALQRVIKAVVSDNEIINSNMKTYSTNVAIYGNTFNNKEGYLNYAIYFENLEADNTKYDIYTINNSVLGNYLNNELYDKNKINVKNSQEEIDNFLKKF